MQAYGRELEWAWSALVVQVQTGPSQSVTNQNLAPGLCTPVKSHWLHHTAPVHLGPFTELLTPAHAAWDKMLLVMENLPV